MIFNVFEKQCENRTNKDWVSTVLNDLEEIGLNVTFADIQEMNKLKLKNMIKRSIRENVLEKLNKIKQNHSKVKDLNHSRLEMQQYFLPNKYEVTKEEIQVIFKLRSKVMRVKMNMKGLYDTHECGVCLIENESQKHIYECKEVWQMRGEKYDDSIPNYEKIMDGNVKEKLDIAKIFSENMKHLEGIEK